MVLVAIDPGSLKSGYAEFHDGELLRAETVAVSGRYWTDRIKPMVNELGELFSLVPDRLVLEWPRVYRTGFVNPDSLLTVAAVVGALVAILPMSAVQLVRPRDWTNGKALGPNEIAPLLSPQELLVCEDLGVDGWDAVGIGLWALGRWPHVAAKPKRVKHRR